MVNVLAPRVVDRGFDPRSSQTTTFPTYSFLFETCLRLLSEGTTYPTYSLLFETCLRLLSEGTTYPTYSLLFETCLRNVLAPRVVDRGFDPRSSQTKDYKLGICTCCFSPRHTSLRQIRSE
jgi:hypothetical protein